MAVYQVWASNSEDEWTYCFLETEDREEAKNKAQEIFESRRFLFLAIDKDGKTIWSNDPDTPAEFD
ncbi:MULTISPECIES: hypothetical protein [unclassified Mesorhizobium]|uniref:hypothetical protein n=1 Tax=unclassified Mesorhizobium TaxID=325217 RepID=UPI00112CA803|nr:MULTISPECIES: hypothetical protein [unclassified Mesorhizobium]TPK82663.1 hypothetical protein FJ548_20370 [Mesorhizobium sp. B2-4-17]TPL06497.1 hypothetical protein FJ938_13610 [Mesorhizobium sp. B2-4-14]